jgi:exodeoxyribonuclease VII large subunit
MAQAWSVSELNRYVRQALETDFRLQGVRVAGEVSGFRAYPSGHWYFTLKDDAAQINCVMWRGRAEKLGFTPRDGEAVEAHGNVTLYETRGQYQLDVAWLEPTGEGALYREFVRLKARLEAEGLFAPERKRPLPAWPRTIGIVTSPAAAALRDVLNILRRRFPLAQVILSPTPVQGDDAPPQIVAALHALAERARPDVIIVARGGGSLEDLWAFNAERVARAIAAMPVPVVSGVGHETDFTIADFVADVRAPTPSAAAELATPNRDDLRGEVARLAARLAEALSGEVRYHRLSLRERAARLKALSPRAQLANARQRVDDLLARAARAVQHRLSLERERVSGLKQALNGVSPLAVLGRGYAVVTRTDGAVVRRARDVQAGDALRVRVSEGEFGARVEP